MTRRPLLLSAFIFLAVSIFNNTATLASPYIDDLYFFTERVEWMPNGWGYQFGVFAHDDDPDRTITSVKATEINNTLLSYDLIFDGYEWFFDTTLALPPALDQMEIIAKNDLGEFNSKTTKSIDPKLLDFVYNVHTNNHILSPTFYWDSVKYADRYRIRISNSSGKIIYNSLDFTQDFEETYHAIPDNILALNENYTVRISATETLDGVPLNRSSLLYRYSTVPSAVPEPTSALLLSAGLLVMTYASRRKSRQQ